MSTVKPDFMNNFINNSGTQAPLKSKNAIYVGSSVNQLFLNILNPYHHFSWAKVSVIVEQPVFDDDINDHYRGTQFTKEQYDNLTYFDENTFTLSWGLPFKEYLDSKDSILYPMFIDLVAEAKSYIRYAWVNDVLKWKKLVNLYIAHHLELFLDLIKDVHSDRTFNVQVEDEGETRHRKIVIGQTVMKDYKTTAYGRLFWKEYDATVRYMNSLWGNIE